LPSRSSTRGHHQQSDVRDGSFSDFDAPKREVHFAPNNGHRQCGAARPISANKRLMHRSKGIFDHRVGPGGQASFAEILGSALVSTQCWTNAATNFEAALHE